MTGVVLAIGIGVLIVAAIGAAVSQRSRRRRTASLQAGGRANTRRIDPFALSEPWRRHVQSAQSAKLRFDRTVAGTRGGPIKDRLGELSRRLEAGVEQAWLIASRGDEIDDAIAQVDARRAQDTLDQLRSRRSVDPEAGGQDATATIASLEAQLGSRQRMQQTSTALRDRLTLLDARFDELVARGVEVSVGVADGEVFGDDIDELVTDLESLRLAIEDTRAADTRIDPRQEPQTWPPQ